MKKSMSGFTIVELLIVIVVIAILAAISVLAYSGVQQRANNTAIIDAASKSLQAIQAYIAANGSYPITSGSGCITTTSGCYAVGTINGNSTLDTNMATIGTLPRSVPGTSSPDRYGVYLTYSSSYTVEGKNQPMLLIYYISGSSQSCGLSNVVTYTSPTFTISTTGYTLNTGGNTTLCYVSVPGPVV